MTRKLLIDGVNFQETRVTLLNNDQIEHFEYDNPNVASLHGNIYLGIIKRIEPSLQAAFLDFGQERQGFLPLSEIHVDYYQVPIEDREEEAKGESVHYSIQEVIRPSQVMLVQVMRDETRNKGAALTTYLSLAGRYCVLKPNVRRDRGDRGGLSQKITSRADKEKMLEILEELPRGEGQAVVIRTSGAQQGKESIAKDFQYLKTLWDKIRKTTLESIAPTLINEEASLMKRAIREHYRDGTEVLVQGGEAFEEVKAFVKSLDPSFAKQIQLNLYKDKTPLFEKFQVEEKIKVLFDLIVVLPSGGYIVINTTEALVAIDVNSGRSTKEFRVEETALKTNLEAAEEIARQLRLREIGGLIVVDFIDMEESKHRKQVEARLKDAMQADKARWRVGCISNFGLLEMSRQRMGGQHTPLYITCEVCKGTGMMPSKKMFARQIFQLLRTQVAKKNNPVLLRISPVVAQEILNQHSLLATIKAEALSDFDFRIDSSIGVCQYDLSFSSKAPTVDKEKEGAAPSRRKNKEAENKGKRTLKKSPASEASPKSPTAVQEPSS